MALVIALDENGIPDPATQRVRPNWRDSDGKLVSDQWLIDNEGLYPLDKTRPEHDESLEAATLNGPADWTVGADQVTATYTVSDRPLADAQGFLTQTLAAVRFRYEANGISFTDGGGTAHKLHSNRGAQSALTAERLSVDNGERADGEPWKTIDGFVPFANSDIISAYTALRNHVRAVFQRESEVDQLITDAGSVNDLRSIRDNEMATGWPSAALFPDRHKVG